MSTIPTLLTALGAACLVQACGVAPPVRYAMAPVLRISDGDGADPAHAYQLGRQYERLGAPGQAAQAYAHSIELDPGQLDARNAQAVLMARQGRLEQATALLQRLVTDFPQQAQPLSNLGYVYHLQGREPEARDALQRALALQPGYAQARANLALIQAQARVAESVPAPIDATAPAPSRIQVLQLTPNEFRLQVRPVTQLMRPMLADQPAAPSADGDAQLQIVNGHGATGLGQRVRKLLNEQRLASLDAAVVDQRRHYQRRTILEYLPGRQAQAQAVQTALLARGLPALLLPARALPGQLTLRLVLGHDVDPRLAGLVADDRTPPAQLSALAAAPDFNQE